MHGGGSIRNSSLYFCVSALFCVPELGNQYPPRHTYSSYYKLLVRRRCQPSKVMLSSASIVELGLWDRREAAFDLLSIFSWLSPGYR